MDPINRFLLSEHPEFKDYKGDMRDIDREDLVVIAISYGLQPIKVEADYNQMTFFFKKEEFEVFENKYISNIPILLSTAMYAQGREYWRNTMTLWRSKLRSLCK